VKLGISLLALGALLGDCGHRDRPFETVPAHCDVGGKPGYFVPASSPSVLIGCARLGVSGKRVELSGSRARIDGAPYACVDPAYGRRGRFIPGICVEAPSRLLVRDASRPRQGVRGYAFVVWGTAPASTSRVIVRSNAGMARAAVFDASRIARRPPFAVFIAELPLTAACGDITVVAKGPSAAGRTRMRQPACAPRDRRAARGRPGTGAPRGG
jgi:hypothetical protein